MLLFLLKFSACLTIFLVFYKLLLEKESIHIFKRFYLLGAIIIAILIPTITFIQYIEPVYNFGYYDINTQNTPPYSLAKTPIEDATSYISLILWIIYILGVLLFSVKFLINLLKITNTIKQNPKDKSSVFTKVLLRDLITPHTFFNYIFLNRVKFETQQIPQEVLLHEETHAKQKHSLDIIFIELLQVIFWFHPLIYFAKSAIKLNHEFLADQAVLNQGINPSLYQKTLLTYSSHVSQTALANAINYSLIKKRFKIMKSKTSKKAIWLRSLLLLPLLGGLLFSFSSTKKVEKEVKPLIETKKSISYTTPILDLKQNPLRLKLNGKTTRIETLSKDFTALVGQQQSNLTINAKGAVNMELITTIQSKLKNQVSTINLSKDTHVIEAATIIKTIPVINGITCDNCTLFLSKKSVQGLIVSTTTGATVTQFRVKFSGQPTERIKGNKASGNSTIKTYLEGSKLGDMVQIFDIKTKDETLSPVLIKLVNKNNPKYSNSPTVKKGDKSDLPAPSTYKYKTRTLSQIIANTPKYLKSGYHTINGKSYYYITYKSGETTHYNKAGYVVDKNGTIIPPPPPPPSPLPPPAPKKI